MADHVTPEKRSQIMRAVKSKNTTPEMVVRRAAHRLGLRFRLHVGSLPGRPDLVFPKWRTVIFVHGCFWHRHAGCPKATNPKSNVAFWEFKFAANVSRDEVARYELARKGWRVLTIWQCEVRTLASATEKLKAILTIPS